ncbi:hypothetical protein PS903_04400 [Pseudomonas fluorescens]|nr:hypothetical protein PS903_04400 [Pseudomonas fluorescens]
MPAKTAAHSAEALADRPLSLASQLLQGIFAEHAICGRRRSLWEPACRRRRWHIQQGCWLTGRFRWQASSYRGSLPNTPSADDTDPFGSWLAGEDGGTFSRGVADRPLSLASQLLQGIFAEHAICGRRRSLWEPACRRRRWHIQQGCWLTGRFRWQASSYRGSLPNTPSAGGADPCGSRLAGGDGGTFSRGVADRPLSLASQLLQGIFAEHAICGRRRSLWEPACRRRRWHIQQGCWLTGRFRWQASSYRGSLPNTPSADGADPVRKTMMSRPSSAK